MAKTKQRQQLDSDVEAVMRRIRAAYLRLKDESDLRADPSKTRKPDLGEGFAMIPLKHKPDLWKGFAMIPITNAAPRGHVIEMRTGYKQLAFKLTLARAEAFAVALEAGFVESYPEWLQSREKGIVKGSRSHKRWLARRKRLKREIAEKQAQLAEAQQFLASVLPATTDD